MTNLELTSKQRLIRAIQGKETDHVPFAPFLAYYFDFLPQEIKNRGMDNYIKEMGADLLLRGAGGAYEFSTESTARSEKIQDGKKYVTLSTAKGELHMEYTYMRESDTWFLSKHPVSTLEELFALKCYYDNITVTDTHEKMNEYIKSIGEDGLVVPVIGTADLKSSFQSLLETWVGTENLVYLASDYPEDVHEVVESMKKVSERTVEAVMNCDVEFCLSWEDSSTTNLNPSMYTEFIAPEISGWVKRLHEKNIGYIQHACGLVKDLLAPIAAQGVSAIESLTPPHTGNVPMDEANRLLPQNVSIIGGIDPVFLLNSKLEELEAYVKSLLATMKGRGFVLANSDSCPPGVEHEKFLLLSQMVKDYN